MKHLFQCIFVSCICQVAWAHTVTDGEVLSTSFIEVGTYGSYNTLMVSAGGKVEVSSVLAIGHHSYFSTVTSTGEGSLIDAGGMYIGGRGSSLLVQNGGVVRASSLSLGGDSTTGVVYSELINRVSVTGAGSLLEVSGNLSIWSPDSPGDSGDPFDLPREIPAYLTVSSGGTVIADGGVSVENGSWLNLGSGGRLETPSIRGGLTVYGTFAPGASATGSIVEGGLTIATDGTLEMELGGYLSGTEYDQLTVTGASLLNGSLDVILFEGFSPTNGARFNLFNWNGEHANGVFTNINLPTLTSGQEWVTSELYESGAISVIPEPSVLVYFAVFGAGLCAFRRLYL